MSDEDTAVVDATSDAPVVPVEPVEETVTLPKAQADALRRELAEATRKAQKLELEQKKAEEARAAEQGEWQKLAEERAAELERTRGEAERVAREARVTRIATRAGFIDPTDVIGRLSAEDAADDASVEAALEGIASSSPHLVAKEAPAVPEIGIVHQPDSTPNTAPTPPPGKAPLRTQADVEALSDKEFQARYAEVQAVLAST